MVYSLVLGSYIRLHNRFGNLIEGFSCAQALFGIDVYTVLSTTTHARTHTRTHAHTHTHTHACTVLWECGTWTRKRSSSMLLKEGINKVRQGSKLLGNADCVSWKIRYCDKIAFVPSGRKIAVNTCAYSRDGGLIAGALYDGSIQIWKNSPPFVSLWCG